MSLTPIPAEPPISGLFWTLVVPAALFAIAAFATLMLYRHFARNRDRGR